MQTCETGRYLAWRGTMASWISRRFELCTGVSHDSNIDSRLRSFSSNVANMPSSEQHVLDMSASRSACERCRFSKARCQRIVGQLTSKISVIADLVPDPIVSPVLFSEYGVSNPKIETIATSLSPNYKTV